MWSLEICALSGLQNVHTCGLHNVRKVSFLNFERIVNHGVPLESGDGADHKHGVISRLNLKPQESPKCRPGLCVHRSALRQDCVCVCVCVCVCAPGILGAVCMYVCVHV